MVSSTAISTRRPCSSTLASHPHSTRHRRSVRPCFASFAGDVQTPEIKPMPTARKLRGTPSLVLTHGNEPGPARDSADVRFAYGTEPGRGYCLIQALNRSTRSVRQSQGLERSAVET